MPYSIKIIRELEELDPKLRGVFLTILEEIERNVKETVKKSDFDELKQIVAQLGQKVEELAEAQKRTEQSINELTEAHKKSEERITRIEKTVEELAQAQKKTEQRVNELAEAQKRTEKRVEELAEAQKRTEQRVNELAEAQKKTEQRVNELAEAQKRTEEEVRKLAIGLGNLRGEVGGLSRTISYAFENEAYRRLPEFLKNTYGIEIKERFVRTEIQNEEINFFAKGIKDGKELYIVGEAKLRLDEGRKDFEKILKELNRKIEAVKSELGDVEVIKMIVTHFAKRSTLKLCEEEGIIVVQSFEW